MKKTATVKWVGTTAFRGIGIGMRTVAHAEMLDEVAGAPAAMLRYDGAFQHRDQRGQFGGVIAFPAYSIRTAGIHKGAPTFGRWTSFSVQLELLDEEAEHEVAIDLRDHPGDWITYRYPRPGGSLDYGALEAVTWAAILEGKVVA